MKRPNSAGVLPPGMAPCESSRSFSAGAPSALADSCWTRLTISAGVPAGASRPNHELASKPLTGPASAIVGTSGKAALRSPLVTASAISLPALTCGSADGRLSNIRSIVPPIRSSSAGPEPRYGKWTM